MRWSLGVLIIGVAAMFYYEDVQEQPQYNTLSVGRIVAGFYLGFLLYYFWRRFPLRNAAIANVLEIAALIMFIVLLNWGPRGLEYLAVHLFFAFFIYVFASDLGIVSRVLGLAPFQWLGQRSFSIYMFHGVVTIWMFLIVRAIEQRSGFPLTSIVSLQTGDDAAIVSLPHQWMNDAITIAYMVAVPIGGSYIHKWIENPSRIYFSQLATATTHRLRHGAVQRPL